MLISEQLRAALTERYQVLGPDLVGKYRKDLLTLMGNFKRVKTYEQARKVCDHIKVWNVKFEDEIKRLQDDIKSIGRASESPVEKRDADVAIGMLGKVWQLEFEVGNFPYDIVNPGYNYRTKKHDVWLSGNLNDFHKDELRKWDSKVRKKATIAWKVLKEIATAWEKRGERPKVQVRERERAVIEGFPVVMVGYEEGEHREALGKLKVGLKFYRERASRVLPWLLKHQLPIECHFTDSRSADASYEGNHILMTFWGIHGDKRRIAHILAHEMGHHVFRVFLSKQAAEDWTKMIRGDYRDLDLRTVVSQAREGETTSAFEKRISKESPVLYLQLDSLTNDPSYSETFLTIGDIKKYLDRGGDPIVHVPANPISGYGSKNPEEAFCEAFGLLVGYGPRTLQPPIRKVLQLLAPAGMKMEWRIYEENTSSVQYRGNLVA